MTFSKEDLVMLRSETKFGYTKSWWRVKFVDNDGTFVGELERCHWLEYEDHKKGDHVRHEIDDVKNVYQEGMQFCYGDNISIGECEALCRNK